MISVLTQLFVVYVTLSSVRSHLEHSRDFDPRHYQSPDTALTLTGGRIQGYSSRIRNKIIHKFKGLPYSEPPEEEYRFQAPESKTEWDGFLDAANYSPPCPAWDSDSNSFNNGSEDCLYYNVFTTQTCLETANCPVLFYISDKAEETEDVLIEKYVMQGFIVVTFNFRNGIFGFLNMVVSSDDAPFNVGFLDIVLALKTVKQEISKFGGDVNSITIMNGPGLNNIVEYLMASEEVSEGLVKNAVITVDAVPRINAQINQKTTAKVLKEAQCDCHSDIFGKLDCLKKMSTEDLVRISFKASNGMVQLMGPETDGQVLPFTGIKSLKNRLKKMPTFVILPYKIQPPTLAFQELCHEYLAIFGISTKTVMECVSHHKNGEDLFHQAVIAYTSMLIQKLSDSEENNFFIRTEAGTANVLEKLAGHVKMFMAGNTQAEGLDIITQTKLARSELSSRPSFWMNKSNDIAFKSTERVFRKVKRSQRTEPRHVHVHLQPHDSLTQYLVIFFILVVVTLICALISLKNYLISSRKYHDVDIV